MPARGQGGFPSGLGTEGVGAAFFVFFPVEGWLEEVTVEFLSVIRKTDRWNVEGDVNLPRGVQAPPLAPTRPAHEGTSRSGVPGALCARGVGLVQGALRGSLCDLGQDT